MIPPYVETTTYSAYTSVTCTDNGTATDSVSKIYSARNYYTYTGTLSSPKAEVEIVVLLPEIEYEIILIIKLVEFYIIYIFNAYLIRAPPEKAFIKIIKRKNKMKTKKEYPVVKSGWIDVTDPEYELEIKCPNKKCKRSFQYHELYLKDYSKIAEGNKVNCVIMCPYCATKFRLQVKEV